MKQLTLFTKWVIPLMLIFLVFGLSTTQADQIRIKNGESVTWSGTKDLNTIVIVESGGTLTIDPGTEVKIFYADVDNNSIGDVKIIVEDGGTLIAEGTYNQRITFTHREMTPFSYSHWGGIQFDSWTQTDGTGSPVANEDVFQFVDIENAHDALVINRTIDVMHVKFEQIGNNALTYNAISPNNLLTLTQPISLFGLYIQDIKGSGIIINQKLVDVKYTIIGKDWDAGDLDTPKVLGNGIEINATNVSLDWIDIYHSATGILNKSLATNTIISNVDVSKNTKSGLFNLDGIINVTNSRFNSNEFNGIVNSSGTIIADKVEAKQNLVRGIYSGGTSSTDITNSTLYNNKSFGFEISSTKPESDLNPFTGTAEAVLPNVTCVKSNIAGNNGDTIQVFNSVNQLANFQLNWWGKSEYVGNLVRSTVPGMVDYLYWQTSGEYNGILANLTKVITIIKPATGDHYIVGDKIPLEWTTTGNIAMVAIEDDVDGTNTRIVSNTGELDNGGYVTQAGVTELTISEFSFNYTADPSATKSVTVAAHGATASEIVAIYDRDGNILGTDDIVYGGDTVYAKIMMSNAVAFTDRNLGYDLTGTLGAAVALVNTFTGVAEDPETGEFSPELDRTVSYYKIVLPDEPNTATFNIIYQDVTAVPAYTNVKSVSLQYRRSPKTAASYWDEDKQYWEYTESCCNMTVQIADVKFYDDAEPPAEMGTTGEDIYIGAFYLDQNFKVRCAGYSWVQYHKVNPTPVTLTVFGDDPSTNDIDGIPAGGNITFKVWRGTTWDVLDPENADFAGDPKDRKAIPYIDGTISSVQYTQNADVELSFLKYERGKAPLTVDITQTISLKKNWNMISGFVTPSPIELFTAGLATSKDAILKAQSDITKSGFEKGTKNAKFQIIKDGEGKLIWDINENGTFDAATDINTLGTDWDITKGYFIKISDEGASLRLVGPVVTPQDNPLELKAGWNLIPYLRRTAMSTSNALATILNKIELVKDQDGLVFWPSQSIATLSQLEPNKSYCVKLSSNGALTYPPNTIAKSTAPTTPLITEHYIVDFNSDNSAVIGISSEALNGKVSNGDEIGVFNSNGILVGATVYEGTNTAVVVWGKEFGNTESKGLENGEAYQIKVWDKDAGKELTLRNIEFSEGQGVYSANGISFIAKVGEVVGAIPTSYAVSQNFPNPFNPSTKINFALPLDSKVTLRIYNILGQQVAELINDNMQAGYHSVDFNAKNLSSGVYLYEINAGEFHVVKKMNLLK